MALRVPCVGLTPTDRYFVLLTSFRKIWIYIPAMKSFETGASGTKHKYTCGICFVLIDLYFYQDATSYNKRASIFIQNVTNNIIGTNMVEALSFGEPLPVKMIISIPYYTVKFC